MSLESNIADLNTATAGLVTTINTQKAALDTAVASTSASAASANAAAGAAVATATGKLAASRFGRVSAADLPRFMSMIRGYRHDLQAPIQIVGFGSSVGVGATLPDPATQAPSLKFKDRLKAVFDPASLYNFQVSNQSVNGSSISQFDSAWSAMIAAGITAPTICVLAYGMNDQGVAIYNAGQTYDGFVNFLRQAIIKAKNAGADVVLMTTPHSSVVNYPNQFAMPSGVPQAYPTFIAAPVAPTAIQPSAATSALTADFVGEGISISVSHRALRINQAMRDTAKEIGCVLIDVERYWFEALQKFQISTGSASGAENTLFNAGEIVHPNLLGHQLSYHRGIEDFVYALAKQTAQPLDQISPSGYSGVNVPATYPAGAVFDVHVPYPDTTTPPMRVNARTGPVDGSGVRSEQKWLEVDPVTGDLIHGDLALGNGGWRTKVKRTPDGSLTESVARTGVAYGVSYKEQIQGAINIQIASPYVVTAFPPNSCGELVVRGVNTGIGTSPQFSTFRWKTDTATATFFADGTDVGSLVFTVAASGLSAQITPAANNTNFQVRWQSLG